VGSFGPLKWGRDREISALRSEFKRIRRTLDGEYEDEALDALWNEAATMKRLLQQAIMPEQGPGAGMPFPPEMLDGVRSMWGGIPDTIKSAVNWYARLKYHASVDQILDDPGAMAAVMPKLLQEMPWILGKRSPENLQPPGRAAPQPGPYYPQQEQAPVPGYKVPWGESAQ